MSGEAISPAFSPSSARAVPDFLKGAAMTAKRSIHLGLFLQGAGHHVSGWRHADAESGSENLDLLLRVVKTAEAAKFDMVFLADGLTSGVDAHPSMIARFEPLTLLGALAMVTERIGLAATASTTYGEPYHLARAFASIDHLSHGRAAWNIVTTSYARSANNFSKSHPSTTRATPSRKSSSRWCAACGTAGPTTPSLRTRSAASMPTRPRCGCSTMPANITR